MKIVAISQRVDDFSDRSEKRDGLDQNLIKFLLVAGYIPVPIPNSLCATDANHQFENWISEIHPQAVLLSGGNDIDTCLERDAIEVKLLDYAKANQFPVLGICRGMQMMAVWAGAKLKSVTGHVGTNHMLTGEITQVVNSYHDKAVVECPHDFLTLACSEDGGIEAIRHRTFPWEGWMWHPEREKKLSFSDVNRLKILFG